MSIRLISLTTIFVLGLLIVSNVDASCCCGGCCGCGCGGCGGCGCCQPCANCLPCGNPPLLIKLPPTPPKLCCCCCKPCCCGCCPCCCGCGGRKRRSILPENRLNKQHLCTKATRNCKRCAAVVPTTPVVSSTVDKVENKPKKSEKKIRARRQALGQMFGQSLGLMPSYRSSLKFAPMASNCECI